MKQSNIIARIFIIAVVVATILNGSSFWLKRVGWLEPHLYRTYWNDIYKERGIPRTDAEFERASEFARSVYPTRGVWTVFKFSKDAVFLIFIIISFLFMLRGAIEWRILHGYDWLFVAIGCLFLYAFAKTLLQSSPLLLLAGLRSFLFLGVTIVGAWAVRDESLDFLAKSLLVLVLFQLLLAPIEFVYGMPLFTSERIGNRIVGTMLQPSSFGIVSGLGLIWYFAFSHTRKWLWWLTVIVSLLVFLSGSGTAVLLLLFASIVTVWPKVFKHCRKWLQCVIIASGGAIVLLLLPLFTGRSNVYESFVGRLSLYKMHIFTGSGWCELLFGRGLGAGTNTAVNLLMDWSNSFHGSGSHVVFVADSTPLMLTAQIGIIGLLLVYGILFLAVLNDPQARIFYLSIILVSLTMNIIELFPVNFILGLLLARSFSNVRNKDFTSRRMVTDYPVK